MTLSPKLSLPGLKHGSVQWGKINAFRHKAIEPFRACSSTGGLQTLYQIQQRHRPLSQSGATGRILTAESTASTSRKRFLAITSQSLLNSHFSNVSIDLLAYCAEFRIFKITGVGILTRGAPPDTTSLADPPALVFHQRLRQTRHAPNKDRNICAQRQPHFRQLIHA